MDYGVMVKIAISALAAMMVAFGQSYTQHPDARALAHIAAMCVAAGSYLMGLMQDKPTASAPAVAVKPMLLLALGLGAMLAFSGCTLSPSADVIKAMAGDPATVCVQVNTIYGTVRVARTNITAGNVACNGDGLSVKSDGAQIGVPIIVTPQISVGPAMPR